MDQRRKIQSAGSENHGAYMCRQCGWAFPNPHPSPKHRRAHKRICGKPKGSKRVDSGEGGSAHGVASDDEHISDEDYKTPSSNVVDKSNNAKAISVTGEIPNRLPDEKFSDEVAKFSPSVQEKMEGSTDQTSNAETSAKKDQGGKQSLEDIDSSRQSKKNDVDVDVTECTTKFVELETDSRENEDLKIESGQVDVIPSELVSEKAKERTLDSISTDELIQSNKEHVDNANTLLDSAQSKTYEASGTDSPTSIVSIEGYNGNKEGNEKVIMLSVPDDVPVTDQAYLMLEGFKDHKGTKLYHSLLVDSCETIQDGGGETKIPILTNFHSGELSEGIEVSASSMHGLEDDCKHEVGNDRAVISEGNENAILHFGELSEGIGVYTPGMHVLEYDDKHEVRNDKSVFNKASDNVIVLSVPDDVSLDEHAELMPEDFIDHEGVRLGQNPHDNENVAMSVYSGEQSESPNISASVSHVLEDDHKHEGGDDKLVVSKGKKNIFVHSVPDDIPAVGHAEKNHKGGKVGLSLLLDSWGTKAPGSVHHREPSEGTKMSASVIRVLEDDHKNEDGRDDSKVDHAELLLKNVKDHKGGKLDQSLSVYSCETVKKSKSVMKTPNDENVGSVYSGEPSEDTQVFASVMHVSENVHIHGGANDKLMNEEGNKNIHLLSVVNVDSVVDYGELMLEDCKDLKETGLPQSTLVDTREAIKDGEDETKTHESESVPSVCLGEPSDGTEVFSSVMLTLEDVHKQEGGNTEPMVKEVAARVEADVPEFKPTMIEGLDEAASDEDDYTIEMEKGEEIICLHEGHQLDNISDNSVQKGYSEAVMEVLPDRGAEANLITNLLNTDNPRSHEKAGFEVCDSVRHADNKAYKEESIAESKISSGLSESEGNPSSNMLIVNNVDGAGNCGMTGKTDVARVESDESDNSYDEAKVHDGVDVVGRKLPKTVLKGLDGFSDITVDIKGDGVDSKGRDQGENADLINVAAESSCREEDLLQKSTGQTVTEGPHLSPSDNYTRESGGDAFEFFSKPTECKDDNSHVKHIHCTDPIDLSVDSNSQTDSVEANWGSVSVLSMQSDTLTAIDAETEKPSMEKPKVAYERQHDDKSDLFEAPSFMTLVEPRGEDHHKLAGSEMQADQKLQQQPKTSDWQAGWFPSLTSVVNESKGRKKNEEIIAKVTNWSTGKQHGPLKNLLGEASSESRPRSLDVREDKVPLIQKVENSGRDTTSLLAPKVMSILNRDAPLPEPGKQEMAGDEWNSPARYPTDIKREKRKVKGKSYWVQFVCCSSGN